MRAARGGLIGTSSGQPRSDTTTPQPRVDPGNDSFFDDPGHGEKLQARNGCLGTIGSRGFEAKTNFLIDVYALINSSNVYKLKGTVIVCSGFQSYPSNIPGYIFKVSFTTGTVKCIYMPKDAVYYCVKFKKHFDKQQQDERMTLLAYQKTWKDLMRKIVLT